MQDRAAGRRPPDTRLRRFLVGTSATTAACLVATVIVWRPPATPTAVALVALYIAATTHPVLVRHRTRAEFIVLAEMVAAVGVLALPTGHSAWVVGVGALLSPFAVRRLSPLERMRRAPLSRHVLNVSVNVLGAVPLVLLGAVARPRGPAILTAAVVAGLVVHGVLSHLVVTAAIHRSSGGDPTGVTPGRLAGPAVLGLVMAAGAVPVGFAVRAHHPDWPLLVALSAMLVAVSRARMDRDHVTHQLRVVTTASEHLAEVESVAGLDAALQEFLKGALRCGTAVIAPGPPTAVDPETLAAPLGPDTWVHLADPVMGGRWTRLDRDLLDAVLAVAAPERRRLANLAEARESARFASLVLTAVGRDIGDHLDGVGLVLGALHEHAGDLDERRDAELAARGQVALGRAHASVRDLEAIGAPGATSVTLGADLALFARRLDPAVRVDAQNVRIVAAPAVVRCAVANLVRTAQRRHAGDEPVEVVLASTPRGVEIEVRDRGPGLEGRQADALLRTFTELADAPHQPGPVTLGLVVARGLAESVDGTLRHRVRPGGGAVFTLRLPSAEGSRERVQERVVLGPGPDRHAQAPAQPRLA